MLSYFVVIFLPKQYKGGCWALHGACRHSLKHNQLLRDDTVRMLIEKYNLSWPRSSAWAESAFPLPSKAFSFSTSLVVLFSGPDPAMLLLLETLARTHPVSHSRGILSRFQHEVGPDPRDDVCQLTHPLYSYSPRTLSFTSSSNLSSLPRRS